VHGKTCRVEHNGKGIFAGLPSPFMAARYHSLCVELTSPLIETLAIADDGVIMGVQHVSAPLCGVQFHPESFLTEYGHELVMNFLRLHPSRRSWSAATDPRKPISRATFTSNASAPGQTDIRHEISSV
jgi:anthranilate synthase component 2